MRKAKLQKRSTSQLAVTVRNEENASSTSDTDESEDLAKKIDF